MHFKQMMIGTRLAIGFALVFALTALTAVVAYVGWTGLADAKHDADVIVHERNVKTALATKMQHNLNTVAISRRRPVRWRR